MATKNNPPKDFCILILTHKRPNKVHTIKTLEKCGYTGPWYLVVDDTDNTIDEYRKNYGSEKVIVFSKEEISKTMDEGDNSGDRRTITYARNASFDVARKLGYKYFMQLDDDYKEMSYAFSKNMIFRQRSIFSLNKVIGIYLKFFISVPEMLSIAFAQRGDFIGGISGWYAKELTLHRKAMNSFICSVDRPFKFVGRLNEDVNTYTTINRRVGLLFTMPFCAINQLQSQTNSGGITEAYREQGTYMKAFYSVCTLLLALRSAVWEQFTEGFITE